MFSALTNDLCLFVNGADLKTNEPTASERLGIHLKFELTETGIFLKICVVNFSVLGLFFHRPLALILKAQPGDDVTLSCQAPDVNIEAAEWRRTDLKKEEYVFFYQDGHIDSVKQHPSFKNRVELKDREMKNGDLSVILKNVTEYDNGTYECHLKIENVDSDITQLSSVVSVAGPHLGMVKMENFLGRPPGLINRFISVNREYYLTVCKP
uniref:Ig-like domain-containing protein n=1 Tax=Myripristis murdjan TaxID=586833 RepID=A0A667ZPC5_9TELE